MPPRDEMDIVIPGDDDTTEEAPDTEEVDESSEESEESEEDESEESEESEETEESSDESDDSKDKKDKSEKSEKTDDEKEEDELDSQKPIFHRPAFRAIREEFPTLFKKFPELRTVFFRERDFTKIFPTLNDAQEAAELGKAFQGISESLLAGSPNELLSSLKESNEEALGSVVENFLPAVYNLDKKLFFKTVNPLMERFVQGMAEAAKQSGDDNMRKAALYVGKYMTGEFKIPTSESREDPKNDAGKQRLDQERQEFNNSRYSTARLDVVEDCEARLNDLITPKLDADLSDFVKEALTNKIITELNKTLSADEGYQAVVNSLWRQWAKVSFSGNEFKKKITSAYLTRAKQILPGVRTKVMAESAKKGQKKQIVKKVESTNQKVENNSTSKKIDWSKTSDADYLNGKITYLKE